METNHEQITEEAVTRLSYILRLSRSSPTEPWMFVLISAENGDRHILPDLTSLTQFLSAPREV